MMTNWLLSPISLCFILCYVIHVTEETGRKRKGKYTPAYLEYLKRYNAYKKLYYSQYQPGTKIKGRCDYSPNWKINGTNPVLQKTGEGYIVILYLLKRKCKECFQELKSLHVWAEYYKRINKKIAIIALNKRGTPISQNTRQFFPLIKIYEEPVNENIFGKLKGKPGDILIYDQCGRHIYYYGYPYSSLVKSYVRLAVQNTEYHYKTICGLCVKKNVTTTKSTIKLTDRPVTTKLIQRPLQDTIRKPKAAKLYQRSQQAIIVPERTTKFKVNTTPSNEVIVNGTETTIEDQAEYKTFMMLDIDGPNN